MFLQKIYKSRWFEKIEQWQLNRQKRGKLSFLDTFLSYSYGIGVEARRLAYDYSILPSYKANTPVISVGGIFAGGSGKTPFVIKLLQDLPKETTVLMRGYRSKDEELLYKNPVVVQKNRIKGATLAYEEGAKWIVLDDGFQHRRLKRDLEIVMIEVTQLKKSAYFLPKGLLRDTVRSLKRAHLVAIHGIDTEEELGKIEEDYPFLKDLPLIGTHLLVTGCFDLSHNPVVTPKKVVLLSAIGNPEAFFLTVKKLGIEVVDRIELIDHALFPLLELERYAKMAKELGACLLCTQKDAVKIDFPFPIYYLKVDLTISCHEELYSRTLKQFLSIDKIP